MDFYWKLVNLLIFFSEYRQIYPNFTDFTKIY